MNVKSADQGRSCIYLEKWVYTRARPGDRYCGSYIRYRRKGVVRGSLGHPGMRAGRGVILDKPGPRLHPCSCGVNPR
jgi:hypothetical protein